MPPRGFQHHQSTSMTPRDLLVLAATLVVNHCRLADNASVADLACPQHFLQRNSEATQKLFCVHIP